MVVKDDIHQKFIDKLAESGDFTDDQLVQLKDTLLSNAEITQEYLEELISEQKKENDEN